IAIPAIVHRLRWEASNARSIDVSTSRGEVIRLFGSGSRQPSTIESHRASMPRLYLLGGSGRLFKRVARGTSGPKGNRSVRISYRTTPKEYTSDAGLADRFFQRSGAI